MGAIPPNSNLEGFIKSTVDGIEGAFKKGVKYGRYLEREEHPLIRCKKCEHTCPDPLGRDGVLFCEQWERFTRSDGYCHEGSKRLEPVT